MRHIIPGYLLPEGKEQSELPCLGQYFSHAFGHIILALINDESDRHPFMIRQIFTTESYPEQHPNHEPAEGITRTAEPGCTENDDLLFIDSFL